MDLGKVQEVRAEMERANARRLQPRFIRAFFEEAFAHLDGRSHRREGSRLELSRVPGAVRTRDRLIGAGAVVLPRYERVCFDKEGIDGPPPATLIAPGHPLLDAIIDLVGERHGKLLRQGAVLIDEQDASTEARLLVFLHHAVTDGHRRRDGGNIVISERLQFVELYGEVGRATPASLPISTIGRLRRRNESCLATSRMQPGCGATPRISPVPMPSSIWCPATSTRCAPSACERSTRSSARSGHA